MSDDALHWPPRLRRSFAHAMLRDAILTYAGLGYRATQEEVRQTADWLFGPSTGDGPGLSLHTICSWAGAPVEAVRRAATLTREEGDVLDLRHQDVDPKLNGKKRNTMPRTHWDTHIDLYFSDPDQP